MLGGGQLGGVAAGQLHTGLLHQFHKAVKLVGGDEGVHRVGEEQDFCFFQCGFCLGEVLFQLLDLLAYMQHTEAVGGEFQLQKADGLQRDAVFTLGAAVDDKNFHKIPPGGCTAKRKCGWQLAQP